MARNESNRLQTTSDFCKSHSARGEREPFKISPSKLSKKELEDHYYSLLDNNIALKKMVNAQTNQVKLLSSKLLRLTAAAKVYGRENSCCAAARSVINEQKESISELKTSNDKMLEKIKSLNTRLCSAKQYVKRSPLQKSQCLKCSRISLVKNTSAVSAIHTKRSDANIQTSASCQYYDNMELLSAKSVRTDVSQQKDNANQCDENKCKTEMESLKKEISDLKEELLTIQKEYTEKLTSLEHEASRTKAENTRMRAERNTSEQSARERDEFNRALGVRLRDVEARCNDVTMQLSVEKKRVLELETQLKSAQRSSRLAQTIEEHLTHEAKKRNVSPAITRQEFKCYSCMKSSKPSPIKTAMDDKPSPTVDVSKDSKYSDDSGFTDPNRCMDKRLTKDKINSDLINRIANLQSQLDQMKISTLKQFENTDPPASNVHENRRISPNISQNSMEHSTPNSASTDKTLLNKTNQIQSEEPINSTPKLKTIVKDKVIRKKRIIEKDSSTNKTEISDKISISNDSLPKSNEKLPKSIEKLPKSNESSAKSNEKLPKSNEIRPMSDENSVKMKHDPIASSSPIKSKSDRRKLSPDPKGPGTYSIKKSADLPKSSQAPSPENTEYEISSISDSSGRAKSSKHWSLGERRFSAFSESYTVTTSDSEPLSEGELPFGRKILSVGERPVNSKFVSPFPNPQEPISKKMESTLEAITTELSRCTRLLNSSRLKSLQT